MPRKYKKPCGHLGCPKKIKYSSNFCKEHFTETRKVSAEIILKELKKRAFQAINLNEYERRSKAFDVICPVGHKTKITWANLSAGKGCGVCAGRDLNHQRETVNQTLLERGYTVLSPYLNARDGFLCRCPNGHEILVQWQSFKKGVGCRMCAGMWKDEEISQFVESTGYRLLSITDKTKSIKVCCPKGHIYRMPFRTFKKGGRCGYCTGRLLDINDVISFINAEGYSLIDDFKNNYTKMDMRCPKGHIFKANWDTFQSGSRCPSCSWAGFNPLIPASLYYIEIDHEGSLVYKIGITNRRIEERFSTKKFKYRILMEKKFLFGYLAKQEEQKILKKFHKHKINDLSIKMRGGHSEVFREDVLKLAKVKAA